MLETLTAVDDVRVVIQVGTAVYFRRKPDVHKRLMVIASFTLYGPVMARWENFYGLHIPFFTISVAVVVTMALYDMMTLRRLHTATLWGAVGGQVAFYAIAFPLVMTGAAEKLINALR